MTMSTCYYTYIEPTSVGCYFSIVIVMVYHIIRYTQWKYLHNIVCNNMQIPQVTKKFELRNIVTLLKSFQKENKRIPVMFQKAHSVGQYYSKKVID